MCACYAAARQPADSRRPPEETYPGHGGTGRPSGLDRVDAKLTVAGMPGKAASTEVAVADGVIDLLDWWAPGDGRPGPDDVERLAPLVVDDVLREEWVAAVVATCDPTWDDGLRPAPTDLPMRVGGWRIDLARAGVRSGFMATILAGALGQQGLTQMIIGVVAAVIPSCSTSTGWRCRPGTGCS